MEKEKAEKIQKIYNWVRYILIAVLLSFLFVATSQAQTTDAVQKKPDSSYKPEIHGILRGKYEYQPELNASRFEVRNARLSASGQLAYRSSYKLEIDLCDETSIKMKDAWVRLNPWRSLKLTVGQQRMPFSIDAHRNPSEQFFANRSFIAKQVGDMRDVGFQAGYDIYNKEHRKVLSLNGGLFNGSNLDEQKTAWFKSPGYSARVQFFPVEGLALVPSIQHQRIAERQAAYTSLDFGAFFHRHGWHLEAEYLHKSYEDNAFDDCNAVDVMVLYQHPLQQQNSYFDSISYQCRYDYMQDHSSGKNGFDAAAATRLTLTDAERHRMTLGITFSVANSLFPTDLRLNYEKYWYPHGGAKESEQDKLVCELVIKY